MRKTAPLLVAVLANYLAQVPYYLHQYYFPHHLRPSITGVLLLGFTVAWFLLGYALFVSGTRGGWALLVSFLAVQVAFYGHAIVLGWTGGGIVAQMKTPSALLFAVFLIGYVNFAVAAYFMGWLICHMRELSERLA